MKLICYLVISLTTCTNIWASDKSFAKELLDNNNVNLQNLDFEGFGISKSDANQVYLDSEKNIPQNKADFLELGNQGKKLLADEKLSTFSINNDDPDYQKNLSYWQKNLTTFRSELSQKLKEYGIDCTVASDGANIKQDFQLVEQEVYDDDPDEIQNHAIKEQRCEYLKNKYSCTSFLDLKCEKQDTIPFDIKLILAPAYNVKKTDNQTIIDFASQHYTGVWSESTNHTSGLFSSHYHNTNHFESASKNINLKFEVSEESPSDLTLNISFDGFCEVKLNEKVIFVGPHQGSSLTNAGRHEEFSHRAEGSFFKAGKSYYNSYDKVSNGQKTFILRPGAYKGSADINLLAHKKLGVFNIQIKVIGTGSFKAKLTASQKACTNWSEKWQEKCTLNQRTN